MGSVYEEITRLETAKADIETAIEGCGVNVPDTDLISAYALYIRQIPSAVFSELNVDPVGGEDQYIKSIKQVNGLIEATTGGLVSSTSSGIVPKTGTSAASVINSQANDWVLTTTKGGEPTWRKLPSNAFKNDNTNTTYSLSGALSANTYITTLTDSASGKTIATIPAMSGASSTAAGTAGLVPAPAANKHTAFLRGDGTWVVPTNYYRPISVNGTSILENNNTALNLVAGANISITAENSSGYTGKVTITNTGVRSTTINGNYLRVDTNGTNVDLTIPYATSAGNADTIDNLHASAFAKIGTYNNLTHAGNEFTFASSAFSGGIWFNYRTASGSTDGDITTYHFGNGKGGSLASISSGYFSGTAAAANSVAWANVSGKPTIPTVTDYYWANVKISSSSNEATTPTFSTIATTDVSYVATLIPSVTETHNLGSTTFRWNTVCSKYGNFSGIVTMSSRLRMVGTSATPAWDSAGAITWTESSSDAQPVSLVYTSYDSYRAPAGLKLMGNQGGEWFEVVGNIYGAGFVKSGSTDSYVLLGGGGHKAVSDFATSGHTHSYVSLGGSTMNAHATISRTGSSVSWYQGRLHPIIKTTSYTGYNAILSMKTTNGSWDLGVYSSDTAYLTYISDTNYNSSTNTTTYQLTFPKKTGTLAVTSDIPTSLPANGGTASKVTCTEASGDIPRPIVGVVNNSLYYTSKVTIRWDNGNVTAPTFTGRLIGSADQVDGYHISVVTSLPATKVNNTIYILV